MGKFQMRHLSGGGNKQSGIMMRKGSAFPKSSALYQSETGQQEAQRKADKNNANANRVYGETTMTSKRVEGGTQKTFTTPYTTSGKGTAERSGKPNASDKDWQAYLDKNFEGSNEKFNASQKGQGSETKTRFIPDPVSVIGKEKIKMISQKPTAEEIKFTPRGSSTTSEKIKQEQKPKKKIKIGKVLKNTGEGIGDLLEDGGEAIGDAAGFVAEKIGDGARFFGNAVGSLFGPRSIFRPKCRSCNKRR